MKERDIIIDIDNTMEEVRRRDELGDVEKSVKLLGEISAGDKIKEEKRAKKCPKPPRPPPPRGLSLDAADQKLIKEISELLMIKRARIKASRKAKAAAPTSSSNLIAMFFTIFFCLVIIFQGCHSSGIWHRSASAIGISTSPKPDQRNLSGSSVHISVQFNGHG